MRYPWHPWHGQPVWIEVCRVVDTVLIDQETVYAPRQSNDRLLLGLKGSLNEYELDLLRQRSLEARREMAKRGELIVSAPVGYIKSEEPSFEKTPDRRVREAIELLFEKVVEIGSVRQTLLWFQEHGLQFPAHTAKSEVQWKRPSYGCFYRLLTNPIYGGVYAYGKSGPSVACEGCHSSLPESLHRICGLMRGSLRWRCHSTTR